MNVLVALVLQNVVLAATTTNNMNLGGVPYDVANRVGKDYSTTFQENVKGEVEFFDVYGEVRTRYSQVYWTRNNPINLPPEIVKRFNNSVMAITGYEVDQVVHTGPQNGSTTTNTSLGGFSCYPSCDKGDVSVPEYNAYNHHYFGWLTGRDAELSDRPTPLSNVPNPTTTFFKSSSPNLTYPTSIVFKENPGGEFRKSYHGYPSGYAQLLHSPTLWYVEPMQIDTHNREKPLTECTGYNPSFLPSQVKNNMTDSVHSLSPLIECPCTTRIERNVVSTPDLISNDASTCTDANHALLESDLESCVNAAKQTGIILYNSKEVDDKTLPRGCSMRPKINNDKFEYEVIFNTATTTTAGCGETILQNPNLLKTGSTNDLGGLVQIDLSVDTKARTNITMIGPADVWFAVGFDAKAMSDLPYAIVVDGNGDVTERKLANHGPGSLLGSTIHIHENKVENGTRTITMSRPTNITA
jgi:hypothetical protein